MTPIIHGAKTPSHAIGKHSVIQDMKSPIRTIVLPEPNTYYVIPLPFVFAWSTVSVKPKPGGTCTVSFTISSPEEIQRGEAIWHEWDHGAVTEAAWHEWENPWMAIRIDCTSPSRVEIAIKPA